MSWCRQWCGSFKVLVLLSESCHCSLNFHYFDILINIFGTFRATGNYLRYKGSHEQSDC